METIQLYYATNRNHIGKDRWYPKSYGRYFSDDGMENLRFGKVKLQVNQDFVIECCHKGKIDKLLKYLTKCAKSAEIIAYQEDIKLKNVPEIHQPDVKLGSLEMFNEIKEDMMHQTDVLIFIHGFNVSWIEAVGSAMTLQLMLNRPNIGDKNQKTAVVLFTWPSDGLALPYVSYKSDRTEAKASGYAFGRGILKLRDFLMLLTSEVRKGNTNFCGQDIHLLCHSMGNYVLQSALNRIIQFCPSKLPTVFKHIFLCASDIDNNVMEKGQPMERLHELCQFVNIYYNRQDKALNISDYTKHNPERLGTTGCVIPILLSNKIHQIDCTPIVHGLIEHSYFLSGIVNEDIRLSIDDFLFDAPERKRKRDGYLPNIWSLK